ncbi:DUF4214 domain-containing protein [Undibacterium fentianense]|uniref:DUF4214 domain-containing protein n=1 Tax=Undibacterium fentianense TaxID=2828728 RepID=A0A941IH78_9BURK|nr:DUF4214 domain-containing protein [Undibacterium fentianense]MBR7800715.1 DUF4214 domain-containing protein [Undibacterium fentianense]
MNLFRTIEAQFVKTYGCQVVAIGALALLSACGGQRTAEPNAAFSSMPPQAAPLESETQSFSGNRANYIISKLSGAYVVTDLVSNDHVAVVKNKKQLRFADVTVNLEIGDLVNQISFEQWRSIVDLYIAFFNRVPDADGLQYWLTKLKSGMSVEQIANSFYSSAIYFSAQTGYTAEMSNQDFVRIIYKNVLGRTGDLAPPDADVNYWAGELARGVSKGSMIQSMLNSARTFYADPTWKFVPQLLDGKLQAAQYFAINHGLTYVRSEDSILKTVAIAAAVLPGSITNALSLMPVKDITSNLASPPNVENLAGVCVPTAEKSWARGHLDEVYLWYKEIVEVPINAQLSPAEYFDSLLVRSKDKFSFTSPQATIDDYFQSGTSYSYGYSLQRQGTRLRVLFVEPGSPADRAGIKRGTTIAAVDNTSLAQPANEVQYAALYPSKVETHSFTIVEAGSSVSRTISMQSASLAKAPVLESKVLTDNGKKIGYLVFNDHIRTAEQALINSITSFREAGIDELVLDVRYNGGGYLYIADELAAMIGGSRTAGNIFETLIYNDKRPEMSAGATSWFYAYDTKNRPLPWLNLSRVFVLTSSRTCSASESIINGLSPFMDVILIGENTCGKPYGFRQTNNCGLAYFAIEFSGVNAVGKGDYVNGFAPKCQVPDDLEHLLGDMNEKRLAAAISYAKTGQCPAATSIYSPALPPVGPSERDPYPWRSIRLVQ